jgi:small subunit ribosomal protein S17
VTAKQSGLRGKVRDGTVVSDKMQKTVVVAVEANFRHRLYKKTVRRVRRVMAHDEREEAALGDRVRIIEAAPTSRHKRWRLLEVLTRADLPEVAPESIDLELLGEVKPEEPEVEEGAALVDGAKAEETVPAEAVAGPEVEAVVPGEVEVAEEVPEIEAVEPETEEPVAEEEAGETAAEDEAEPAEEPAEADEGSAESDEVPDEGKTS